jgi:hypothetical protein
MEHASSPDGYVQSKVSAVAARLLKRGWLVYCLLYLSAFYLSVIGFWVGYVIVHGFLLDGLVFGCCRSFES